MGNPLKLKESKNTEAESSQQNRWKILIVDDDPEVFAVSKMILSNIIFMDRKVQLLNASSAKEAKQVLSEHDDIAVTLLDVVMETEDAGLKLVKHIRNILNNHTIRIILRTGQPGQAPEEKVIVDYDINDYKSKAELTAQKLFTTTIAALRSYRHIKALETNRIGLERVINSSKDLFRMQSMREFSSGVLIQLSAYLDHEPEGILCFKNQPSEKETHCQMGVIAAAGGFQNCIECSVGDECTHLREVGLVKQAFEKKESVFDEGESAIYIDEAGDAGATVAFVKTGSVVEESSRKILEIFSKKISLGFQNVHLLENMERKVKDRTHELKVSNEELKKAIATIKTISGIVPLCAWCNNQIKDDNDKWIKLEEFIEGHSDAQITHGMCPSCAKDFRVNA